MSNEKPPEGHGPGTRGIKNGDCVFFKDIRTSSRSKQSQAARFKHFGWGVLLGAIPPFGRDPNIGDVIRALGSIGYVSFDDVGEFLGDEIGAELVKKFEEKYYVQPTNETPPIEESEPSRLVDITGKPIEQ